MINKMKNLKKKAFSLFLIIFAVLFFLNDFSYQKIKTFDEKRVKIENYLVWKKINIDYFFSSVLNTKDSFFHYFKNNKTLIKENKKLSKDVDDLREIIFINGITAREKSKSIYENFDFHPIQISYNKKSFYGIVTNEDNIMEKGDLIVNYCGIIGKVSHIGNDMAVVMLSNHPKFLLPVTIEKNKDNIGLYSFSKNELTEIKKRNDISNGDRLITMKHKDKIPEGILIGTVDLKKDKRIIRSEVCKNMSFGFVLKHKK